MLYVFVCAAVLRSFVSLVELFIFHHFEQSRWRFSMRLHRTSSSILYANVLGIKASSGHKSNRAHFVGWLAGCFVGLLSVCCAMVPDDIFKFLRFADK